MIFGTVGWPITKIPPPSARQCANEFGAIPCEESWDMTDKPCRPNPKTPSTAPSDVAKIPVSIVLQLLHNSINQWSYLREWNDSVTLKKKKEAKGKYTKKMITYPNTTEVETFNDFVSVRNVSKWIKSDT